MMQPHKSFRYLFGCRIFLALELIFQIFLQKILAENERSITNSGKKVQEKSTWDIVSQNE